MEIYVATEGPIGSPNDLKYKNRDNSHLDVFKTNPFG